MDQETDMGNRAKTKPSKPITLKRCIEKWLLNKRHLHWSLTEKGNLVCNTGGFGMEGLVNPAISVGDTFVSWDGIRIDAHHPNFFPRLERAMQVLQGQGKRWHAQHREFLEVERERFKGAIK